MIQKSASVFQRRIFYCLFFSFRYGILYVYVRNEFTEIRNIAMKHRNRILCFALVFLLILPTMLGCAPKRTVQETQDTTFGVDVAKYQGIIDWQQVAGAGIDFAIVRVGYRTIKDGELREDPSARYNLQEAAKAGIKLGVYFFSTAITEEEAKEMLRALSGRTHDVFTGVCVMNAADGKCMVSAERTGVKFRVLSEEEICAYVAGGEPMDKAGAYAIQGGAGAFVEGYEGSRTNVIGLPVEKLTEMLMEMNRLA